MYMSMRDECIERALSALSYSEVCAEDPFIPAEQICAEQGITLDQLGMDNVMNIYNRTMRICKCEEYTMTQAAQQIEDQAYIKLLANIGLENIEKTRY